VADEGRVSYKRPLEHSAVRHACSGSLAVTGVCILIPSLKDNATTISCLQSTRYVIY